MSCWEVRCVSTSSSAHPIDGFNLFRPDIQNQTISIVKRRELYPNELIIWYWYLRNANQIRWNCNIPQVTFPKRKSTSVFSRESMMIIDRKMNNASNYSILLQYLSLWRHYEDARLTIKLIITENIRKTNSIW